MSAEALARSRFRILNHYNDSYNIPTSFTRVLHKWELLEDQGVINHTWQGWWEQDCKKCVKDNNIFIFQNNIAIFQIIQIEIVNQNVSKPAFQLVILYWRILQNLHMVIQKGRKQITRDASISGQWYHARQQERLHGARLFRKARWAHVVSRHDRFVLF